MIGYQCVMEDYFARLKNSYLKICFIMVYYIFLQC